MRKEKTTQLRASMVIDDVLLLELEAEKNKKHIGLILQELLSDSPKWQEIKQKFKNFKDEY